MAKGKRTKGYRRGVWRTVLKPQWLALLALVVGVCGGFGWLGSWQLGVARDTAAREAAREAAGRPVSPLVDVLQPGQPFPTIADARTVTATGTYVAAQQVLVPDRVQGNRTGWWVVAALRTDSGWLPVVRGWVATPEDPRTFAFTANVTITGVLQPDEAPPTEPVTLPGGQVPAVDAADLANRWGTPIYNAFLVAVDETGLPTQGAAPTPETVAAQMERVPPPGPQAAGLDWQNAAYALQWWLFAGFAVLLWWKMVRQDAADSKRITPMQRSTP
ncbi:MAG: SURF1 family protein [Actinomycetota bacterium]